jgi:hypothetical protein
VASNMRLPQKAVVRCGPRREAISLRRTLSKPTPLCYRQAPAQAAPIPR